VKDLKDSEQTSLASWPFTDKCSTTLYDRSDLNKAIQRKYEASRQSKLLWPTFTRSKLSTRSVPLRRQSE